eukprot:359349-Chlamydomonas_euryale.AAC.1
MPSGSGEEACVRPLAGWLGAPPRPGSGAKRGLAAGVEKHRLRRRAGGGKQEGEAGGGKQRGGRSTTRSRRQTTAARGAQGAPPTRPRGGRAAARGEGSGEKGRQARAAPGSRQARRSTAGVGHCGRAAVPLGRRHSDKPPWGVFEQKGWGCAGGPGSLELLQRQ